MFKNLSLQVLGLLQALGIFLYCCLVGVVISKGFIFIPEPTFFAPVIMLTLFVTSATVCGLLYLGYPFLLFWRDKKPNEAIELLVHTTLWLVAILALLFVAFIIFAPDTTPNLIQAPPPLE